MDWSEIFYVLLHAEGEADVLEVLQRYDLLDDRSVWQPLGGLENNFAIVGNQQTEPTAALVEKIINAIDANLMAACFEAGLDPEGENAPGSMVQAVEQFFKIRHGQLGNISTKQLTELSLNIQLVATGHKDKPSYLIIDKGEGQTPASFPDTFLSLARSNKIRIPFVQGKFNSGGTGVLQFCGEENFQLIASRRHPAAPARPGDATKDLWGFTLIRRIRPSRSDRRRNSMYVYLAPEGKVPHFSAPSIKALPTGSSKNKPAEAYREELTHGTVVKLYNYAWRARSTATTESRYELEKYLHSPCLPIRITETRSYSANYYSTTMSGIWAAVEGAGQDYEEDSRLEDGFPAAAVLDLPGIGSLGYKIAVYRPEVNTRRVPHGVFFTVNGQVHGSLPPDFISRRLEFDELRSHLLVSVDCTTMPDQVREDLIMGSRDRLRKNKDYDTIESQLTDDLKNHPGLKAINAARRAKKLQKALESQEDVVRTFQELLRSDPSIRRLFGLGEQLVTQVGPTEVQEYKGMRFPTYFRVARAPKSGLVKSCPVNRTCRVEFETDAVNDYFTRVESPGEIQIESSAICEYQTLWNGIYTTRFRPHPDAKPGDIATVKILVTDPDREARGKPPFDCSFTIEITQPQLELDPPEKPGGTRGPRKPQPGRREAPGLAVPNIIDVRKEEWGEHDPPFSSTDAMRIRRDGKGGYDLYVNLDNGSLLSELRRAKDSEHSLIIYWFKWGLALCAMGMVRQTEPIRTTVNSNSTARYGFPPEEPLPDLDMVELANRALNGLGSVIIPIVRNLYRGPDLD